MSEHRNDVPNGVNIIKVNPATRKCHEKVLPFGCEDFFAKNNFDMSSDNISSYVTVKVSHLIAANNFLKLVRAI